MNCIFLHNTLSELNKFRFGYRSLDRHWCVLIKDLLVTPRLLGSSSGASLPFSSPQCRLARVFRSEFGVVLRGGGGGGVTGEGGAQITAAPPSTLACQDSVTVSALYLTSHLCANTGWPD